ncbi:MAG: efflux RND transporter permease subunit, partial [Robiginitalea sp.]
MSRQKKNADKEFRLSSWAIDNPSVVYVMIGIFFIIGLSSYFAMPREAFPEVKETKIYISTIYPGNTAEDIERLITDPLEDRLKNVSNVVELTSTSQEDYSMIIVEFDEDISVENAKQKVKDEVDGEKAGEDWPVFNNAKVEPNVFDLNLTESFPILNVNITGDYPVEQLKDYAELLEDEIEDLTEIKEVDIRGAQNKEVEVAVDIYKMMAAKVSFQDVLSAIANGNMTMSAGNLKISGQRRTIRILGEVETPYELEDFVVKAEKGSAIYLKDIATVKFREEDKTTYAREHGESVVMLDVKKRAGKNAIDASYKIRSILADAQADYLPTDLNISVANDSTSRTLNQVDDLVNNIIFGIIFMILSALGYTMNTMILFGLIMGLGMLVDNGVVVVENVYRLMEEEGMPRTKAAKKGIGEIAVPIIISTTTTVAAFVPLGLWPGIMGEFMIYFPITLSVVLGSSLFVAIFMNSMLVSNFMEIGEKELSMKQLIRLSIILGGLGLFILLVGGPVRGLGSLMIVTAALFWMYRYLIKKSANRFQRRTLKKLENSYEKLLKQALRGRNVFVYSGAMVLLLIGAFISFGASLGSGRTKVEFFPDNTPNEIYVYIEYPQGTAIEKTNEITRAIERRVYGIAEEDIYMKGAMNLLVESSVSQVGKGAENPFTEGGSAAEMPHRGKITLSMREFKFRKGRDSEDLRKKIQDGLKGIYPGVTISVEKDAVGPSAGYPINIELEGQNYDTLINMAERMRTFINTKNIAGIEELKIDVNKSKPSMEVVV